MGTESTAAGTIGGIDSLFWNGMFWNQLIYPEHSLDPVGGSHLLHLYEKDAECPAFVACLCVDGYASLGQARKANVASIVAQSLNSFLPESRCRILGFTHTNAFYFCGDEGHSPRHELVESLNTLRMSLANDCRLGMTLGIAFVRERSTAGLRQAAQYAVVAQRRKTSFGFDATYVYEKSFLSTSFSLAMHWDLCDRLNRLVRTSDPEQVGSVLAQVSAVLFRENYLSLSYLRPILQSYIILMAQSAREAGAEDQIAAQDTQEYLNRISVTYDYSDLRHILLEAAMRFTQLVKDHYYCASGRMISNAEEIVKTHIEDPDLALSGIAIALDVNPSYLSRRFKQEKGIGLSNYISLQRIEWAKRLLLDRKRSITEVAYTVGFGSTQNFGRVFRSIMNCSPSEYRSNLPE